MKQVKIVDDDPDVRKSLTQTLELAGFCVRNYDHPRKLLNSLEKNWQGIVISDLKMPDIDGQELLRHVKLIDEDIPFILITGHGDVSTAVQAIHNGAYDFIEKPFRKETLIEILNRACEKIDLVSENRNLRKKLSVQSHKKIIGQSPEILLLKKKIASLAEADIDVLINGETGTGKELVAQELHRLGPRFEGPFVAVNCAAIADSLVESELFGHEVGSFTGATKQRIGKFEHANNGTIFLDEVESIPQSLAAKILRVLQERKIVRVGSNKEIKLDIRVLAATKVDLKELSDEGKFRQDLYYRLNVVEIHLPPLRHRLEDIPSLFEYFLNRSAQKYGLEPIVIDSVVLEKLSSKKWPGNVRELKNFAERYMLSHQFSDVDFFDHSLNDYRADEIQSLSSRVQNYEKLLIVDALKKNKGDVGLASDSLKIPKKTLYDKIKRYAINRSAGDD